MKPSSRLDFAEFSLVLGGPLFQLLSKVGLTGEALELLRLRILFIAAFSDLGEEPVDDVRHL